MKVTKIKAAVHDERGDITDILAKDPVDFVTIITSKKGSTRGNHYHKLTYQYVYVLTGSIRALAQHGDGPVEAVVLQPGDLLLNVPYEKHALEALADSEFLVLTKGPRGAEDYETDTYRLTSPLKAPSTVSS